MKAKNLLKKSISILLCFSTFYFSVGMLSGHSLGSICNLNLIDNVFKITNCTPWYPKAPEDYQSIPHAVCKDNGRCNLFNDANQLIGNNSPIQQSSNGSILNLLFNPFVFSAFIGLIGNLASYVFKAYDSSRDKHAQQKNEEQMKKDGLTDPIAAIGRLDYYLKGIEGQDKALNEVRKFVLNLIDERNQKLQGTSKKEDTNNILYLWGSPGIGKSLTAESLVKALNGPNAEPFILEPSQLDPNSKIFGVIPVKVLKGEINQPTPVVKQLTQNPYTVFIFNEIDKYDKKGEKKYLKELEETLRTIHDHGYIYINGEKIDGSKAVFILTSNADLRSTKGTQTAKDSTGSLTQVDHDVSFLDRIKVVEFENLNSEAYKKIAEPKFEALQQRYLNEYNVYVTFEDNLLDKIANLVEQKNQGARPIQDFINAINSKLLNEVILQGAKDNSYRGKAVEISLENKKNDSEFKIKDSDNYKKTLLLVLNNLKRSYLTEHNIKINISDQTLDELSSFLKETNLPVMHIANSLEHKIYEEIILKENSKKSFWQKHFSSKAPAYFGKTYDIQFNNYQWKISEVVPSEENKSANTTPSQDSEDKEIAPELSEVDKQKAEIKSLEDSKADTTLEKGTAKASIEAAVAA